MVLRQEAYDTFGTDGYGDDIGKYPPDSGRPADGHVAPRLGETEPHYVKSHKSIAINIAGLYVSIQSVTRQYR